MAFMIIVISIAEAIVPFVKLLKWVKGIIALYSKAGGSTITSIHVVASSVTMSTSLFALCQFKITASMGDVASMISKRWLHPLVGGVILHCGLCSSWHVL